jgi:hypothetical protein
MAGDGIRRAPEIQSVSAGNLSIVPAQDARTVDNKLFLMIFVAVRNKIVTMSRLDRGAIDLCR